MRFLRLAIPMAAFAVGFLPSGATVVQAQQPEIVSQLSTPQPSPQITPPHAAESQLSETDVQAFASAATEVRQLNQKWLPRLRAVQETQGPDAAQQVREEAMAEMEQAVSSKGLTIQRYHEIYELAEANPEIERRVQERMETVR
jgi:hypothetical protein